MSRHDSVGMFQNITSGAMTGTAVITSSISSVKFLDNVGIEFVWSGSPTGTFQIQVSANYDLNTHVSGDWVPLIFTYWDGAAFVTSANIPTSLGSPYYLDITLTSAPYLRVVYTNSSGSGTLQSYITAKGL